MSEAMAVLEASPGGLVVERVLGMVSGPRPGPTLVCIGGLHGNEPAGVLGLVRVLEALAPRAERMRGDFVALAGNRSALAAGRRFMERDLNRAWTDQRIARLRDQGSLDGGTEDTEQMELLAALQHAVGRARGAVYVLDLHTTSGPGGPFSTFSDALPNRRFATPLPVPMILGLEELVDGTLLAFLGEYGLIAVAFESGQHGESAAVDRAEAAIWISIASAGLLPRESLPEASAGTALLREGSKHLPPALEMSYRHAITDADLFVMRPGYENFQPVRRGEVVASDATGDVRVHETSRMLMPLYQVQGEDGFFLIREFSPFWLRLSAVLRYLRVDRVAHWLPGVRRDRETPDTVIVDKRIARFFAKQLFHLLGFRQLEDAGALLVMRRHRFDEARYRSRLRRSEPPV